jgi:hypothetical protein
MTPEWQDSALGSAAPLAREIVSEIEKTMLQLIVDGFQRWQKGGFQRFGDHENDYTIRLVASMNEIRRERNLSFVTRYQHVEPSEAMLEGLEDPAHAPHIDVTVSWDFLTDDFYFSIECKRLAPDDLARLYVIEGMARFVRGYYGAKAHAGSMVGYIIRGTPSAVIERVNAHVQSALALGPGHTLVPADPVGWLKDVFASNHPRSSPLQTIRLTHLFFDLNGIASAPTAGTGRTPQRQRRR